MAVVYDEIEARDRRRGRAASATARAANRPPADSQPVIALSQELAMTEGRPVGAGLIVPAHGAALTNLAYLNPQLTVIEMMGSRTSGLSCMSQQLSVSNTTGSQQHVGRSIGYRR